MLGFEGKIPDVNLSKQTFEIEIFRKKFIEKI
jgi:hypothetical protein